MKVSGYYIYCIISMFVVIVVPTNCTSGDVQLMNGSSDSEDVQQRKLEYTDCIDLGLNFVPLVAVE